MPEDLLEITRLLSREIPEIASGAVRIMAAAREPGRQTKVAVTAAAPGVDPIGVCVGWKGTRVQALQTALGTRVDIHLWSDLPTVMIERALAPGRVVTVETDSLEHRARVTVRSDQIPRVLGPDGLNRALATRLTGCAIDIVASDAA